MRGSGPRALGRRNMLEVAVASGVIALSGCLGGPRDEETHDESDGIEPVFPDHPGDEPASFPESHFCNGICGMDVANYPEWNAQLAHVDGTGAFFCTTGCLFGYLAVPDHHDAPADIDGVWVTDHGSGDLVDGWDAVYVLIRDSDLVSDPMGINPRPFADETNAVSYVDNHEDDSVTEEDVVQLDDVDLSVASIYRGDRLPRESNS